MKVISIRKKKKNKKKKQRIEEAKWKAFRTVRSINQTLDTATLASYQTHESLHNVYIRVKLSGLSRNGRNPLFGRERGLGVARRAVGWSSFRAPRPTRTNEAAINSAIMPHQLSLTV